jgi:hypothetical protein
MAPGHHQRQRRRDGAGMAAGRRHPGRTSAEYSRFGTGCRRSWQRHRHRGRSRPRRPPASAPAAHSLAAVYIPGTTTGRPNDRIMSGYPVHRSANPWHGHRPLRRANIHRAQQSDIRCITPNRRHDWPFRCAVIVRADCLLFAWRVGVAATLSLLFSRAGAARPRVVRWGPRGRTARGLGLRPRRAGPGLSRVTSRGRWPGGDGY